MSAESLKQLKNLYRRFAYATKTGNNERIEELVQEEEDIIRSLMPSERYDYMMKEAIKLFGGNSAEIEEAANSTDPGIKAGYLDGYISAFMEFTEAMLSKHVVSLNELNERIDETLVKINEGRNTASADTSEPTLAP